MNITIGLAFIAGFVSFVSPCVLPLVPAYIGYLGGRVTNTVAARAAVGGQIITTPSISSRFITVLHGLAFVAGFTLVFVAIGLLTTAFVQQIGQQNVRLVTGIIGRVGGIVIIFFGLHFMGIMPALFSRMLANKALINSPITSIVFALAGSGLILWAFIDWLIALPVLFAFVLWLILSDAFTQPERFWTTTLTKFQNMFYSDTRRQMTAAGQQSFASSVLMGVVFSAGWTPCIGPVYGAVLTMAANGGNVAEAGSLLLAYSLGLGIPFLLAALLIDGAQTVLRRLQRHMHTVELASGAFLVFIGVMVASGQLQSISQTFSGQFADVSVRLEECTIGFVNGELAFNQLGDCLSGATEPQDTAVSPAS